MQTNPKPNAFTLIELLVVISIIALLAGLALPALQGALDTARKAQAATMCNQLATAVTMYNTEYGVWPAPSGQTGDYFEFFQSTDWISLDVCLNGNMSIATATSTSSPISNTRAIQFMSFNKKDLVGYPTSGNMTDCIQSPYTKAAKISATTGRLYHLIVDTDYNGTIQAPDLTSTSLSLKPLAQGVAVWAYGSPTVDMTKAVASYR